MFSQGVKRGSEHACFDDFKSVCVCVHSQVYSWVCYCMFVCVSVCVCVFGLLSLQTPYKAGISQAASGWKLIGSSPWTSHTSSERVKICVLVLNICVVYIYIYIYVCTCIYSPMWVFMNVCMCVCVYKCVCVCVSQQLTRRLSSVPVIGDYHGNVLSLFFSFSFFFTGKCSQLSKLSSMRLFEKCATPSCWRVWVLSLA